MKFVICNNQADDVVWGGPDVDLCGISRVSQAHYVKY